MKKVLAFFIFIILTASVFAQSPEKMSYQAVIRDTGDNLVTSQSVGIQISIVQDFVDGTIVYVERHFLSTNTNGLVSLEIGTGTIVLGDFANIDWSDGPFFIKTETDLDGGASYTISGTSQLVSVPYALHAKTAENVPSGTQTGEMQYWNGSEWVTVPAGNEGQVLTFTGDVPTWITTVGMGDVPNPTTGKIWMDRNLGASQVAASSSDINAYGDLYQWGRATDGHEIRTSGTSSTLSTSNTPGHGNFILSPDSPYDWLSPQNDNLWQGVNGTNNPCPSGYRLPTEAEWNAERQSWSSNDAAGAFTSPLKLPLVGFRSGTIGSLINEGGRCWSSTVAGTNSRSLYFVSNDAGMGNYSRSFGGSVRCIKD
jgi:uncharacterized protein (TIGR02145 family)